MDQQLPLCAFVAKFYRVDGDRWTPLAIFNEHLSNVDAPPPFAGKPIYAASAGEATQMVIAAFPETACYGVVVRRAGL